MVTLEQMAGKYVLKGVDGGYTAGPFFMFQEEYFAILRTGKNEVAVYRGVDTMEQLSILEHKVLEGPRMRFCDEHIECKGKHLYTIVNPIYNNDGWIGISKDRAPLVWVDTIYGLSVQK